ncbi:hypothetical protein [Streptomyces sp. NPDC085659]|uniref:hypothetical protein n=1 Tax=Streptomyces sp. NPDC085659 TaxID=3155177 RepID=UPI00344FFD04
MICARCEKPMRPEDAETRSVHGATKAGATVRTHREWCEPPKGTRPRTYPS